MRILLVGEYSGLHNALKEGLVALGHEVVLLSHGDGFKKLDSDISWDFSEGSMLKRFNSFCQLYCNINKLRDFDVVQFINPIFITTKFGINSFYIDKLTHQNKKNFLVCAGDDSVVWKYWDNYKQYGEKYSWIEEGRGIEFLKTGEGLNTYEQDKIVQWNLELAHKVDGIIPIMYEYAAPYREFKNLEETIGIPINVDKIKYKENIVNDVPLVFHGINRAGVKGTKYVEEAFGILSNKYKDKINCQMKGKMSYSDYLLLLDKMTISIDQVLSYSMGVNALTSMAMGKVTLGGVEEESLKEMKYDSCPAINIKPNSEQIVEQLENIIFDKNKIKEIGYQSRLFIENNHHYIKIAKKYLKVWMD